MIEYHHFKAPDKITDLLNDHQMTATAFEWKTDENFTIDGSHWQHLNSLMNLLDVLQQIVHSIIYEVHLPKKANLGLIKPLALAKCYRKYKGQRNWLNNTKGIQ